MARVFVSHATEDDAAAGLVHGWLVEDGHEAFLDHDLRDGIELGEEWEQRLHERLRWADAVVCLITSDYIASAWCTTELGVARSWGRRLLPISVQPALTHPMLPSIHYTDLTRDPAGARTALGKALRSLDVDAGWGWPGGRSPYPGLEAFDSDRQRVFCGRREEIGELAGLLRSPAEQARGQALFLVGPSGCGKSSLVRAGLIPELKREPDWWCLPPIVPGADPVGALLSELVPAARSVGLSTEQVQAWIGAGELATAVDTMLLKAGDRRRRLLLVVDQFEELLTQADPAARVRFAELLRPALRRSVRLVVTLRPEYLGPLLAAAEMDSLPKRVHPLSPLRREALHAVITEPARSAGLTIDDDLVELLVEETRDGKALPLLAYTLARLTKGLRRGDRLPYSRYDDVGGIERTLVTQADAALVEAGAVAGRTEQEVLRSLLRLVTVDEWDHPARLWVPLEELTGPVAEELRPFVERRLLVTDTERGGHVIGVAHEAFLSAWPPLQEAIGRAAAALRARADIEQAARQWEAQNRPTSRLWGGGQLAAAVTDTAVRLSRSTLVSEQIELGPVARAFLQGSIRRDRWVRRRAIAVLSALLVLALVAAAVATVAQRAAVDQQLIAASRQLIAQADVARATDPRSALMLGIAAARLAPGAAAAASLGDTLTHTRYARTLEHDSEVVSVAVAPDGRTLATGTMNGTVVLWDLAAAGQVTPIGPALVGHSKNVYSVAFAPGGRTLASAGGDGIAILWDVSDPARAHRVAELRGHTGGVHAAVFAGGRPLLATTSFDHTVRLWDVADPARPRPVGNPLTGHDDVVTAAAFSPDGLTLATGGFDRSVLLWDLREPEAPRVLGNPLLQHTSAVWSVEFAPDGRMLASGSADGSVVLWDVADPVRPSPFPPLRLIGGGQVYGVAFDPAGHTLAAADSHRAVTLWDITNPAAPGRPTELVGHTNHVYSVAFTPDARSLVSGGADRLAIRWDLSGPPQPRPLGDPTSGSDGPIHALAAAPGGHTVATGTATGAVDLWDVGGTGQPRQLGGPLTGHAGTVWSVAFSADGRTLVSGGEDGTVRVLDVADPSRPRPAGDPLVGPGAIYAVAISPDGRTMAAAGADRRIRLWDLSAPSGPRPLGDTPPRHTGSIFALAFAPDGRTLVSGGADNAVMLWDVADPARPAIRGEPLVGHTGHVYSVAFAAHRPGLLASAGNDGSVILWDLAGPRILGRPLLGHAGAVYRVAFAPDGRTLASGGADHTALLWDLTEVEQPRRLGPPVTGHTGPVNGVWFSTEAPRFSSGGGDGRLRNWDVTDLLRTRDRPIEAACTIAGRGLGAGEWAGYLPGIDYRDTCPGEP